MQLRTSQALPALFLSHCSASPALALHVCALDVSLCNEDSHRRVSPPCPRALPWRHTVHKVLGVLQRDGCPGLSPLGRVTKGEIPRPHTHPVRLAEFLAGFISADLLVLV